MSHEDEQLAHMAEQEHGMNRPDDKSGEWDAIDWNDARCKLSAIATYIESLENFDDATFLRRLSGALPFALPPSAAPRWIEEELKDGDRLCAEANVQRTEGGRLQVARIVNVLREQGKQQSLPPRLGKPPPQWVTSWPHWHGIDANVTVVPKDDYDQLERELAHMVDLCDIEIRERMKLEARLSASAAPVAYMEYDNHGNCLGPTLEHDGFWKDTRPLYEHPAPRTESAPSEEALRGAIARGWCSPENEHKEMDATLADAIFRQVCTTLGIAITPRAEGAPK